MNLYRHRFLFYPLIFFIALFLLDKIFLLPEARNNFIQPGGMLYYSQRESQIRKLRAHLARKKPGEKILVVFGDSRSFALGDYGFKMVGIHGVSVYNFAGPQALPAYHAYLAGRLFKGVNRPDYLLMGISPDGFNRQAGILASPVMNHGLSREFIDEYRSQFPKADYKTYESSRRYALAGMGFSMKTLIVRAKNTLFGSKKSGSIPLPAILAFTRQYGVKMSPGDLAGIVKLLGGAAKNDLKRYSLKNSPQAEMLGRGRGAQYAWFGRASAEKLKRDTDRLAGVYFRNFTVASEQFFFLEETLRRARAANIKTLVFRPRVNPYLLEKFKQLPLAHDIWRRVERISRSHGARALDLNRAPETSCSVFYDASHLSITCFPPITRFLARNLGIPVPPESGK